MDWAVSWFDWKSISHVRSLLLPIHLRRAVSFVTSSLIFHRFPSFLENNSALNSISALFCILFVSHTSSSLSSRSDNTSADIAAFSKRFCFLWFFFVQFSQLSSIEFLMEIVVSTTGPIPAPLAFADPSRGRRAVHWHLHSRFSWNSCCSHARGRWRPVHRGAFASPCRSSVEQSFCSWGRVLAGMFVSLAASGLDRDCKTSQCTPWRRKSQAGRWRLWDTKLSSASPFRVVRRPSTWTNVVLARLPFLMAARERSLKNETRKCQLLIDSGLVWGGRHGLTWRPD